MYIGAILNLRQNRNFGGISVQKYSTKQRRALLNYLKEHTDEALTVDNITDALSDTGISRSAIYRNLSALESENSIKRVTKSGTKKIYYQFSGKESCHLHLHLSCTRCGKTIHLGIAATETLAGDVMRESDFELDKGNTILYGICSDCK